MKTILFIILIAIPFAGFSQPVISTTNTSIEKVGTKNPIAISTPQPRASKRAKHIRVNYKKSNDIISIKAYRKSLNVKVNTKSMLC